MEDDDLVLVEEEEPGLPVLVEVAYLVLGYQLLNSIGLHLIESEVVLLCLQVDVYKAQ